MFALFHIGTNIYMPVGTRCASQGLEVRSRVDPFRVHGAVVALPSGTVARIHICRSSSGVPARVQRSDRGPTLLGSTAPSWRSPLALCHAGALERTITSTPWGHCNRAMYMSTDQRPPCPPRNDSPPRSGAAIYCRHPQAVRSRSRTLLCTEPHILNAATQVDICTIRSAYLGDTHKVCVDVRLRGPASCLAPPHGDGGAQGNIRNATGTARYPATVCVPAGSRGASLAKY